MAADLHTGSPSELKERLEAERRGEPFLVYRDADGVRCIFALRGGERLTAGRRPENDLALSIDPNVSRVHVAFERAGGEWTIVDDGLSRNGAYLNGERVFGHRRLRDGDLLRLGATVLVYRTPGEDPEPTAVLATATVAPSRVAWCDALARTLVLSTAIVPTFTSAHSARTSPNKPASAAS